MPTAALRIGPTARFETSMAHPRVPTELRFAVYIADDSQPDLRTCSIELDS